jgi:hypothetical protein
METTMPGRMKVSTLQMMLFGMIFIMWMDTNMVTIRYLTKHVPNAAHSPWMIPLCLEAVPLLFMVRLINRTEPWVRVMFGVTILFYAGLNRGLR